MLLDATLVAVAEVDARAIAALEAPARLLARLVSLDGGLDAHQIVSVAGPVELFEAFAFTWTEHHVPGPAAIVARAAGKADIPGERETRFHARQSSF